MAVAAAKPEVFTRNSSGLVRVMSPYSAFIYNILTMGLIFPWTYLWAPGALPGGRLVGGILLAMIFEIPIALAYVWLSTALPRSGVTMCFRVGCSEAGSVSRSNVRIRHLDSAMGRSLRLAALLPRVRIAVSRTWRDHGQSDANEHRRLVHHTAGHYHREHT